MQSEQGQKPRAGRTWRAFNRRARSRFGVIVLAASLGLGFLGPLAASAALSEPPVRGSRDFVAAYADLRNTVVLIGDSQAYGAVGVPADKTWVQKAFSTLGYTLVANGAGGTGFVASTSRAKNYPDALASGKWALPTSALPWSGSPLVVVQGGGNDARIGASDAAILANAARLLDGLTKVYPQSEIVMIGTLGKGLEKGGRRAQVDALLAGFARSRDVPFVSAGDWLKKFSLEKDLVDGVHLDADGHQILAEALRNELKSLNITGPEMR